MKGVNPLKSHIQYFQLDLMHIVWYSSKIIFRIPTFCKINGDGVNYLVNMLIQHAMDT